MKLKTVNLSVMLGLILSIISPAMGASTRIQEFAPKPPLGFNSFDSYGTAIGLVSLDANLKHFFESA